MIFNLFQLIYKQRSDSASQQLGPAAWSRANLWVTRLDAGRSLARPGSVSGPLQRGATAPKLRIRSAPLFTKSASTRRLHSFPYRDAAPVKNISFKCQIGDICLCSHMSVVSDAAPTAHRLVALFISTRWHFAAAQIGSISLITKFILL